MCGPQRVYSAESDSQKQFLIDWGAFEIEHCKISFELGDAKIFHHDNLPAYS